MKRINMRLWLNSSQRRTLEMICYMAVLTIGCTVGTICFLSGKAEDLCGFCTAYAVPDIGDNIMLSSMRWCFCMLTISFFLGFCGIGQPFLYLLLAFHGFGTGCVLTKLSSGSDPFAYILSAMFSVIVSITLLLGVRESVRLSCTYIKACFCKADPFQIRIRLGMCLLRYMILALLITAECGVFSLVYKLI